MNTAVKIRKVTEQDNATIYQFILKMAEYEKLTHTITLTEEVLFQSLFVEKSAQVLLAEKEGKPIGFALFFYNFSTFTGKKGLYLEDLFVDEAYRGAGIGTMFFKALIDLAAENSCGRMEWVCLDWNQNSIDFYKHKITASSVDGWTIFRLTEDKLKELAAKTEL